MHAHEGAGIDHRAIALVQVTLTKPPEQIQPKIDMAEMQSVLKTGQGSKTLLGDAGNKATSKVVGCTALLCVSFATVFMVSLSAGYTYNILIYKPSWYHYTLSLCFVVTQTRRNSGWSPHKSHHALFRLKALCACKCALVLLSHVLLTARYRFLCAVLL